MASQGTRIRVALLTAAASIALPGAVQAQDAGANDGNGDIVVTAQRREQRLQDVPVSIAAISAEALKVNRVTNIRDLNAVAPNIIATTSPGGLNTPSLTIRGLNSLGSVIGSDKGIGMNIDGVYVGNSFGSMFDRADIERIEVLRGPQGTLFGRNTNGGAINIVTGLPTGEFGVKQTVSYGEYDDFRTTTIINTPTWGNISARFTYTHSQRDGDIRNSGAGTVWDFSPVFGRMVTRTSGKTLGSSNGESFAATVRFAPSEDLDIVYRYDYSESVIMGNGQGVVYIAPNFRPALTGQPNLNPVALRRPKVLNNGGTIPASFKNQGHSLTINYDFTSELSLQNIAAYRTASYLNEQNQIDGLGVLINSGTNATFNGFFGTSPVGTPALGYVAVGRGTHRQFSNETQLHYDSSFVTLTAGVLYYWQRQTRGGAGEFGTPFGMKKSAFFGTYPGYVIGNANKPNLYGLQGTVIRSRSWGIYSQGEFHVTPQLDLILGARWTSDKKSGIDRTLTSFAAATATVPAGPTLIFPVAYNQSRWTYNIGANFKITDDIMLYAKYVTGFITGGNLSGITWAPETAKSAEAGIRTQFLDGRATANLTAFHVKYGNIQQSINGNQLTPPNAAVSSTIASVGDAKATGFEFESSFRVIPSLTLNAAIGYTDFKYTSLLPTLTTGVALYLPNQRPKWTANFSALYKSEPVFGDARVTASLAANFVGKQFSTSAIPVVNAATGFTAAEQAALISAITIPKQWVFNGRLGLTDITLGGARASLSVWGQNLFNNKKPSYIVPLTFFYATDYQRARTLGVELGIEF